MPPPITVELDMTNIGDVTKQSFQEILDSERRKEVHSNTGFKDCIPLCRDNTFNQALWNLKLPHEHVNFL